jgi:hypothetical protein
MIYFGIFLVVILIIILVNRPKKRPPEKYFQYPADIIKSDNERKTRIERGEHDEMYYAWKDHHRGKSLEQIQQFIKAKRDESWYYWENNRLEYKVLMELSRELEKSKADELRKIIESDQVFQLSYSELLSNFRMISYNPHIYKSFNTKLLVDALEKVSFDKFHPQLITKTPSTVLRWLNAREKEGEYIPDKLKDIAAEMVKQESPEESYKRQRKSIQSNISKAKKDGDWLKTEELEQKLINLETQKPL